MFPIDSNILIGILVLATIGAYALILRKLGRKAMPRSKMPEPEPKKRRLKTRKKTKKAGRKTSKAMPKKTRTRCADHIEYLSALPENVSVPDECLKCSSLVECLNHVRPKKSRVNGASSPVVRRVKSSSRRKKHSRTREDPRKKAVTRQSTSALMPRPTKGSRRFTMKAGSGQSS